MRLLLALALLALPGCLADQPVKARVENLGGGPIEVHLVATSLGLTLTDETFQVPGGQAVERPLGSGTMTVKASFGPASASLTLGGGDCADGTAIAAFTFLPGVEADGGRGGVEVVCE